MPSPLLLSAALLAILCVCTGHPVLYKLNDNAKLEPDLVPVSSTVIPLPIYKVETSFAASPGKSTLVKPAGPIKLITAQRGKHAAKKNLKENEPSA